MAIAVFLSQSWIHPLKCVSSRWHFERVTVWLCYSQTEWIHRFTDTQLNLLCIAVFVKLVQLFSNQFIRAPTLQHYSLPETSGLRFRKSDIDLSCWIKICPVPHISAAMLLSLSSSAATKPAWLTDFRDNQYMFVHWLNQHYGNSWGKDLRAADISLMMIQCKATLNCWTLQSTFYWLQVAYCNCLYWLNSSILFLRSVLRCLIHTGCSPSGLYLNFSVLFIPY